MDGKSSRNGLRRGRTSRETRTPGGGDNPLLPRLAAVIVLGLVASVFFRCGACSSCFGRGPLRVGTYNIRRFGVEPTDMKRLAEILEEARPDVLGLQEVQKVASVRDLALRISHDGRHYAYVLTKCSGRSEMHVGFLYDESRVRLVSTREYPELDPAAPDSCGVERSGLVAKMERTGSSGEGTAKNPSFQLLVLHLIAGGEAGKQKKRREQWQRAHEIAAALAKDGPVAILGDTNSTGFLDDKYGERTFILDQAKRAGLDVATSDMKCTEYFQPKNQPLTPSVLDHLIASPGLVRPGSVTVHGFCAELACRPTNIAPPDYTTVSDHCPVLSEISE